MDINRLIIEPFEAGDRVDVSRSHRFSDCKTTTGTVINCVKDVDKHYEGAALWMVHIELDNGSKIGIRPSYVDLIIN
jgi:hypothetical protein